MPAAELRLQGQLHRRSHRALAHSIASASSNRASPRRVKQARRPTRNLDNPDNASTRAGVSCRLFITAFWCSWISWRELSVTRRPFLCPGNSANPHLDDLHFLKSQAMSVAPRCLTTASRPPVQKAGVVPRSDRRRAGGRARQDSNLRPAA